MRIVNRYKFLDVRHAEVYKAQRAQEQLGNETVVVIDPGNTILCDLCNKEILSLHFMVDDHGAYCNDCAEEKLRYETSH